MNQNSEQDSFYLELLRDFKTESSEHYQNIIEGLYRLTPGNDISDSTELETIYRSTHSLKGAARAVNLKNIERVCSTLEGVFGKLKKRQISLDNTLKEGLNSYISLLKELLNNTQLSNNTLQSKVERNIKSLESLSNKSTSFKAHDSSKSSGESDIVRSTQVSSGEETQKASGNKSINSVIDSGTIRISNEHLKKILEQSENFISIKNSISYYKSELQSIYSRHKSQDIFALLHDISEFESQIEKITDELTSNIRNTLLSTFDSLLKVLPIMVQDLANEYEKEISFKTEGSHIEIDRRILTELKDPLIQILRNSIDHGIETPQKRLSNGKDKKGSITLKVDKLLNQNVLLTIKDDGAGINRERIIESSIKNKIITKEEAAVLSQAEIDNLIFESGISSKKFVTDISGRGIGMSIVAEKIAELGGFIEIASEKDKGTTFTITLPQAITTFRGLLVKTGKYELLIPYKYISKVIRITQDDIYSIGNKPYIKDTSGNITGIVHLSSIVSPGEKPTGINNNTFQTIILSRKNKSYAYIVDYVYREYEGILRKPGSTLGFIKNLLGFSLIKNGIIVPVINVKEVLDNTSLKESDAVVPEGKTEDNSVKYSVLIAEDSITIRSMLRNFVESEGYAVTTAVDGRDALKMITNNSYDIVVTDIEMPNMNGFELTHAIKSDLNTKEIPVILVTALESPEDMKKGMDAGADAYIVKSNFEKSNLVETIKRLL